MSCRVSTRRRSFLPLALAIALCAGLPAVGCGGNDSDNDGSAGGGQRKLTIASWGGVFSDATTKHFVEPFEKETGIEVTVVDVGGGWGPKVEAQSRSGKPQWDVVDAMDISSATFLSQKGLLETLPLELKDKLTSASRAGTVTDFGIEEASVGIVIACRETATACPDDAKEFWDTENFPGARAIVGDPQGALPWAAQAAGANPVYPIDLDQAFDHLEQIKDSVKVWPTSGDQQQQVLRSGEVDMAIMWNGRAYDLMQNGTPLELKWGSAVLEPSYNVVLKDSPNRDAAFEYLEFYATHPELQGQWAKALPYGMPAKGFERGLPAALRTALPSAHQTTPEDGQWFADHQADIQERWQEFLSE